MKFVVATVCIFMSLVSGCVSAITPISDVIGSPFKYEKTEIVTSGYLCIDGSTAYLSTSSDCSAIDDGRRVVLDVDEDLFRELEHNEPGSEITVMGRFEAPPSNAIIMPTGVLLGSSLRVLKIISSHEE